MALTAKQERYARLVASGMEAHQAALEAGCKNHESARKFVIDMLKRENVRAFIRQVQMVNAGLTNRATANVAHDLSYPNPQIEPSEQDSTRQTAGAFESPLEFLTSVFNNVSGLYTPKERISAAIALLPYTESKVAPIGKKEGEVQNAVEKSQNGRFSTLSNQADMFSSEIMQ